MFAVRSLSSKVPPSKVLGDKATLVVAAPLPVQPKVANTKNPELAASAKRLAAERNSNFCAETVSKEAGLSFSFTESHAPV